MRFTPPVLTFRAGVPRFAQVRRGEPTPGPVTTEDGTTVITTEGGTEIGTEGTS